jgi:hypothetical protein
MAVKGRIPAIVIFFTSGNLPIISISDRSSERVNSGLKDSLDMDDTNIVQRRTGREARILVTIRG